jgi:hypothetical protein
VGLSGSSRNGRFAGGHPLRLHAKLLLAGLIALGAAACQGPGRGTANADPATEGSQAYFNGPINRGNVDAFIQLLEGEPGISSVSINSGGGSIVEAIRLADAFLNRNLDLHVSGACLSACAAFLIPAARRVYLSQGSIVGVHMGLGILATRDDLPVEYRGGDLEAERYQALYRIYSRRDLKIEAIQDPAKMLQYFCVGTLSGSSRGPDEKGTGMRYEWWFPTTEYYRDIGVRIEGATLVDQWLEDGLDPVSIKENVAERVHMPKEMIDLIDVGGIPKKHPQPELRLGCPDELREIKDPVDL